MSRQECPACRKRIPKRGRARCPECGYAFRGAGWDGVEAHWKARHLGAMPYREFWASLCAEHRAADPLSCPSCRKGIPLAWVRQCPECAQVFRGRGWAGVEAHWKAKHADVMSYDDFWRSLCPGHKGVGDGISGYLPLGRR
jgi:predicted amidophosphoribosyltransferase